MIPVSPLAARWVRLDPRRTLATAELDRMVRCAFGTSNVAEIYALTDGLRNANFKLRLDNREDWFVLRIYEHDASLCQKEIDLMHRIAGSVPVPDVIHAEQRGLPPFVVMRHVEGITLHELKRREDRSAFAEAAFSAGEALAAIARFSFPKPGWLGPGPTVTTSLLEGDDPCPRFVDACLSMPELQRRMPKELRARTHALMWAWAPQLARLDSQARLVHGDFGKRNLLVRCDREQWCVSAVLDWEFAVSGSPLADVGHFLRYERTSCPLAEPHFSQGYLEAGGTLPTEWRQLSRVVDLMALCESLTHNHLPQGVIEELVELVRATVEDRDPVLPG